MGAVPIFESAPMNDNEQAIALRIKELEGSAQKARLEAMQVAATLLTTKNATLGGARPNADRSGDAAALQARYDMLVRVADDAQMAIDRLQAERHEVKYYR